jgi:TolB-like protein/Flp pilus assembly protein TadD
LRYLFEEYAFDTDRRELHRGSDVVPVAPQVFDLLYYLIRNRERVVTKDDLINAIWNGRVVTDAALTTRLNVARNVIGDSGEEQRLIKTLPRKGFRFVGPVLEAHGAAGSVTADNQVELQKPVLALPDKPSIAVLPFKNLSGDPEQEYFADGMVEDIITALSRFKSLFVIARNSSFTYKGRTIDIKQIGRELGVRYVLEGGVRRAGGEVRITGQLIEAATGLQLWGDKFDGTLENVFELQDSVTERVAGAIGAKLKEIEIALSRRAPTHKFDAYDYCLQAIAAWRPGDEGANDARLRFAYKAIELDSEYGLAYARAAGCFSARKQNRWMRNVEDETAEAMRLASLAITWGKDDENALAASALVFGYVGGELDVGASFAKQAVSLNPNSSTAWSISAWLHVYLGEHVTAFEHVSRAMRLSPRDLDRVNMLGVAGFAKLFLGDWYSAEQFADEAVHLFPNHLSTQRVLAASCAFQNKREQARKAANQIMQLDPTFRLSSVRQLIPLRRSEDLATYTQGLRLAGIPE